MVKKHNATITTKAFKVKIQLITALFDILSRCDSMTEIYEGLRALGGKLNHLNCLTSESRPAVGTAEPGMLHHNEVWVGVSYVASANLIHYGILADDGALALEGIYTAWSTYERTWRDYDSKPLV